MGFVAVFNNGIAGKRNILYVVKTMNVVIFLISVYNQSSGIPGGWVHITGGFI